MIDLARLLAIDLFTFDLNSAMVVAPFEVAP